LREALEDVARREVAFHSKDDSVAEKAASRIVAKLLAGPMAALRRAVQRGEPLDQHAMMLLEMFAPAGGAGAGASDMRRTGSHRAVAPAQANGTAAAGKPTPKTGSPTPSNVAAAAVSGTRETPPLVASQHFN
jgi:hypothetical protein